MAEAEEKAKVEAEAMAKAETELRIQTSKMARDQNDWNQKKSICYVFSDVFSRSPNQEFVQNVLASLKKSEVVDEKNIETTVGSFLLKNNKNDQSSDSDSQDEDDTFEENLQHEIGGLIYTGLVDNIFKIPDDQKMYLLKKLPETEQSHSEEIENEFLAQGGGPSLDQRNQANVENTMMSDIENTIISETNLDMKFKKRRKKFLNFIHSEKSIQIKKTCEDTENPTE